MGGEDGEAKAIVEKAPVRISFGAAGDTDYYIDVAGSGIGVNATIEMYAYCEINRRNDNKIILSSKEIGKTLNFNSMDEIQFDSRELKSRLPKRPVLL